MPMHNLIEYNDNDWNKTARSLLQYHRDEPNDDIANSKSFKFKTKITRKTCNDGNTYKIEIVVPLKCLRNSR